jgi:hypothetical protein
MKHLYFFLIFLSLSAISVAQNTGFNTNGSKLNAVTTAVPLLTISPDARSGAMGDAGVAITPDANANYWNPSKLAFIEDPSSISLSYSPWLRRIFPDVNLAYLSFANKLDDRNTIGASLRYFNLGTVDSYDGSLNSLGTLHPNEFSLDVSLARKFGQGFSMGLTGRYIHSDLTQGAEVSGQQSQSATAIAADVSLYYTSKTHQLGNDGTLSFGADISNIGTKMSYINGGTQYFLPTNLKLGLANTMVLDDFSQITLTFDVNKLLVPTPPIRDNNGNIISGKDDNVSVVSGIFSSFSDAPGGASEELQEITFSPGFEYWYNKQFAIRAGYFYENPNKGNRQYVTLGVGFRSTDFTFDFSYLSANEAQSPLANVLRFSLGYNFGSVK